MEPNSVGPNSSSSNDENHLSKPSCSKETSCSRDGASKNPEAKKTKADFLFLNEIGDGSFSTVYTVKERSTGREFAAKVCTKKLIIKDRKVQQIYREKEALARLSKTGNLHPFIIQVYCTFQDPESLYIVTTLAKGGELLEKLKKQKVFSLETTRFYVSEIVAALAHMHGLKIIHRDLKPENILLSESGHILISDFGSSKILDYVDTMAEVDTRVKRKCSFVGTAQYVSPEVLLGEPVEQACDYWALGVIIYQFVTGKFLFDEVSEYLIYQKIIKANYELPEDFPPSAGDLVKNLVVVDIKERLGSTFCGGASKVKSHVFFNGIDFDCLPNISPPS
ncbi:unnamed protein product [Enterobius vermicularis]|uniref:non-specific serine/threonine protein kinase n=1 Tax=Enterobius vermicularis TaxID=51028 RepID=A0A0N4V3Y1_ENTVE|nr:unnamed protein product [Enterobius vermicularis]